MENLKGKNILLVGATGGIGFNCAKLLSSSQANLFIAGRSLEKLRNVAEICKVPESRTCAVDITSAADLANLQQQFFREFETIDILINAAGMGMIKSIENLTEEDFTTTIQNNLIGPFLLIKEFIVAMKKEKKGLIINIPGVLGKVPMAGAAAYSASKYGLVGMMQCIREEVKRTEIRITNLYLGGADTPFWDSIDLKVQKDKMIQAEEAAKAIWFLCQQPTSGVINEMVLQPFNHQAI